MQLADFHQAHQKVCRKPRSPNPESVVAGSSGTIAPCAFQEKSPMAATLVTYHIGVIIRKNLRPFLATVTHRQQAPCEER